MEDYPSECIVRSNRPFIAMDIHCQKQDTSSQTNRNKPLLWKKKRYISRIVFVINWFEISRILILNYSNKLSTHQAKKTSSFLTLVSPFYIFKSIQF